MGPQGERERFRRLFPKEVETWSKVTISNGDKVHAADSAEEDLLDHRDATFVRVRKRHSVVINPPSLTTFAVFAVGG